METNLTNLAKVRKAFEKGLPLSVLSIVRLCNTIDGRKYISMLRKEGMNITDKWIQKGNKSFKVYRLSK